MNLGWFGALLVGLAAATRWQDLRRGQHVMFVNEEEYTDYDLDEKTGRPVSSTVRIPAGARAVIISPPKMEFDEGWHVGYGLVEIVDARDRSGYQMKELIGNYIYASPNNLKVIP